MGKERKDRRRAFALMIVVLLLAVIGGLMALEDENTVPGSSHHPEVDICARLVGRGRLSPAVRTRVFL
jgi:hypothetical protein